MERKRNEYYVASLKELSAIRSVRTKEKHEKKSAMMVAARAEIRTRQLSNTSQLELIFWTPYSHTLYIYVWPLIKETKFHTSTKPHRQVDCVSSSFIIVKLQMKTQTILT